MNNLKEILIILKKLISYETVLGNDKAFEDVFNYIETLMKNKWYIKKYVFNGRKAMVISNTKDTNLDLIFCTHIDVVPSNKYEYSEDQVNVYGRGSIDMKGSVSVCLHLLKTHNYKKKVAIFVTSDEEIDGFCVQELMKHYTCRLAIVPDGGNNFKLVEEEKGLLQLKISVVTNPAHASEPYNGDNAIIALMNIYNKLIKIYPLPKSDKDYVTSINLSTIEGGKALNQVPFFGNMCLDIRHTSKDTKEDIIKTIKQIDDKCEVEVLAEGSLFKTNLTDSLLKKYLKIATEEIGNPIEIIKNASTSDAIYFSDKNITTILMNPYGNYAHCENEYVTKEGLKKLYNIYEKFLEEFDKTEGIYE